VGERGSEGKGEEKAGKRTMRGERNEGRGTVGRRDSTRVDEGV
jgi:hypothetical protein